MRAAVKARFSVLRGNSTCQLEFYNVQETFLQALLEMHSKPIAAVNLL